MSYPSRSSSTTPQPQNGLNDSIAASSSASQPQTHAASPLDWANFMNFQTPPGLQAGPGGNSGRSLGNGPQQGGDFRGRPDDQFTAFAQGIAISRPTTQSINFRHPYPQAAPTTPDQQNSQSQYAPNPSPLQRQTTLASQPIITLPTPSSGESRSPIDQFTSAKGKSVSRPPSFSVSQPQRRSSANGAQPSQSDADNLDNGLTLDPAAFSRDIRFQIPPFLSNQMGGAPTFPPGGEAWSGFSGANFFSGDMSQGLATAGQLSGPSFDAQSGQTGNVSHSSGHDGNGIIQDGLGSFPAGDGGWDNWNANEQKEGSESGTTFYVNPNPTSNVLASRNQQPPTAPNAPNFQQRTPKQVRSNLPHLNVNNQPVGNGVQSPRTATSAHPGSVSSTVTGGASRRGTILSTPRPPASSGSVQTSAILPPPSYPAHAFPMPGINTLPFDPSSSTNIASAINIASSSTAPYAPPSNTQALLQGPSIIGPSLSDGPGLYSTTGFDMVGVLARVAARKDPKTVLGPVDLSCSFLVVVSPLFSQSDRLDGSSGYSKIRYAHRLRESDFSKFDRV